MTTQGVVHVVFRATGPESEGEVVAAGATYAVAKMFADVDGDEVFTVPLYATTSQARQAAEKDKADREQALAAIKSSTNWRWPL